MDFGAAMTRLISVSIRAARIVVFHLGACRLSAENDERASLKPVTKFDIGKF